MVGISDECAAYAGHFGDGLGDFGMGGGIAFGTGLGEGVQLRQGMGWL
jgi:hypothetical protein